MFGLSLIHISLQMPAEGEALNSVANPRALQVVVFPGAENSFTLWEDDGAAQSKDCLLYTSRWR